MIGWHCKEVGFLSFLSVGGFGLGRRKERTCGRKSFLRSAICLSVISNALKAVAEPESSCFVSIAETGVWLELEVGGSQETRRSNGKKSYLARISFELAQMGVCSTIVASLAFTDDRYQGPFIVASAPPRPKPSATA